MKGNKEKTYIIECNEKQLQMLSMMCDRMSRLIEGQLGFSVQECCEAAWERDHKTPEHPHGIGGEEWYAMRDEVEEHLDALRKLCWGQDKCSYYGIRYDDTADMLYDMHQVMRHQLWLDRPDEAKSNITVDADEAMRFSDEPLINVYRKEKVK